MHTDDFDFDLPRELIAQRPATPRDAARLLIVGEELSKRRVRDLPEFLRPGDLVVYNDTRVIPARLRGRRGDAAVEVTLHKRAPDSDGGARWLAFAKPARRLRPGERIDLGEGLAARVAARGDGGEVLLAFDKDEAGLRAALERIGAMPLPPYIRRAEADPRDRQDYQTVFAAREGAIAAPTAGLHFTPALLDALAARGVGRVALTLHVGAGTFLPVTAENPREHRMQPEYGSLDGEAAAAINAAKAAGGRILAVGSTALRLIETAADDEGQVHPFAGETGLFILPGYRFAAVDLLLTNFHLPRSTLFMLVCAFAGTARMKRAYTHAIERGFRFYSYGDACLLGREATP